MSSVYDQLRYLGPPPVDLWECVRCGTTWEDCEPEQMTRQVAGHPCNSQPVEAIEEHGFKKVVCDARILLRAATGDSE